MARSAGLIAIYRPVIGFVLRSQKLTIALAVVVLIATAWLGEARF